MTMRFVHLCLFFLLAVSLPVIAQQSGKRPFRYGANTCGPADPSYIRTAEESGGQPLFLGPDEVGKSFQLVSELTRPNHVTLLWARGELAGGHDFAVPVDATIHRLMFSLSFDKPGGKLTVLDSDGKEVTASTSGAAITGLNCGGFVRIVTPQPGEWHVHVSGAGRFWLEASGESEIFLVGAEFVRLGGRPGHEGYFRISGQPVAGEPAFLRVELSGKTRSIQFHLISEEANSLEPVAMKPVSVDSDESEYFGKVTLPATPFRLVVTGVDENGHNFERIYSSLFHSETVEVTPLDAGLDDLPAGKTLPVYFKVRNAGAARNFRIQVVDTRNFLLSHEPQTLSLAGKESRNVPVKLSVPAGTPNYTRDTLIVTATATSGPPTTNSAVIEFGIKTSSKN